MVISQHVASRTHTLIGTKGVHTPEGTQQRILGALIDVFTGHHRSRFKALLARTLETTNHIGASSISTWVSYRTLVSVNTVDSGVIQVVSEGAFTAERTICVDADTVLADTWVIQTLIHIFTSIAWSRQGSMAEWTQSVKSSLSPSWAQLTGKSPALSRHLAAAALGLGGVQSFGDRTFSCLEFGETEAFSRIVAAAFVVREYEARLAVTLEAAGGIGAGAKLADVGLHLTLVDIYTLVILHLIARRADTSERSIQILTSSRRASAGQTQTLIDINTVFPILSILITLMAETLERTESIDTLSVPAHLALEGAALIYVHAVVVVCELKAREAEAVVGSHCVFTGTVTTRLSVTLIDIHAHGLVSSCLEAVVAETAIASLCVNTLSMAAHIRNLLALITVHTGPAGGQFEAWRALAAVAAWNVDTVGVALAQVVPAVALINIFTNEQYVVVAEAHWTFTAEAPDLVDTHSIGTDTRDLPALININWLASVDVNDKARSLVTTQ